MMHLCVMLYALCLDAPADETMLSLVTEDDYRPLLQYEFSIH